MLLSLTPCTAEASVASRAHSAPTLFLWSSKYAISCLMYALKAAARSRSVRVSPDMPNNKPYKKMIVKFCMPVTVARYHTGAAV